MTVGNDRTRIQTLDALRAGACLLVIMGHTDIGITLPGSWNIGSYGVCLFCVLSGYLITTLLLSEERMNSRIDIVSFWQRRALRILPAYYLVLTICMIALNSGLILKNHAAAVNTTLSKLPFFATFTHSPSEGSMLSHFWSISVEEQFYCFMPIFLLLVRNQKLRIVVLAITGFGGSLFLSLKPQDAHYDYAAFMALAAGSLLAINLAKISQPRLKSLVPKALVLFSLCIIISVYSEICPYGIGTIAFCILIACATAVKLPATLGYNVLCYFGRVSYGVYLVHLPVSFCAAFLLSKIGCSEGALLFFLTTGVSLALATISWETFEKPILGLKSRINKRPIGLVVALVSPTLLFAGLMLHLFYH